MQVKVTNQHEWMRLALTESKDKKLSLIWSYRGDKATGMGLDKNLFSIALRKWYNIRNSAVKRGDTLGKAMDWVATIARRCQSIEQFVEQMQ